MIESVLSAGSALSDPGRVRALAALKHGELCLCQLVELLGLAPSTVSRHLSILNRAGLVERRKEGRWHYYRISENTGGPDRLLMEWVSALLEGDPQIEEDAGRLVAIRSTDRAEFAACYRD